MHGLIKSGETVTLRPKLRKYAASGFAGIKARDAACFRTKKVQNYGSSCIRTYVFETVSLSELTRAGNLRKLGEVECVPLPGYLVVARVPNTRALHITHVISIKEPL